MLFADKSANVKVARLEVYSQLAYYSAVHHGAL